MRALAEKGIDLVLAEGSSAEDKSPEDIKAEGIIKWLHQQSDDRNAIYYFNELARGYLQSGRLKMVDDLYQEFKSWDRYNPYMNP
jgi:hypothetical protein